MEHVNTLKMYKDYVAAGYTDAQASIAVESLNASFDTVVTKDYLRQELAILKGEIRSDMAFMIILPIFVAMVAQAYMKKKGWV